MNTEKKILVNNGEKKILKEMFSTTYYTVRKALTGNTSTLLGYKIREAAINRGGELIDANKTN